MLHFDTYGHLDATSRPKATARTAASQISQENAGIQFKKLAYLASETIDYKEKVSIPSHNTPKFTLIHAINLQACRLEYSDGARAAALHASICCRCAEPVGHRLPKH